MDKNMDGLHKFCTTNVTEPSDTPITREDIDRLMETLYQTGGSCDICYINEDSVDRMWHDGQLTRREYVWLKLKFRLGPLKRSVRSGVQFVRRITGMAPTE